MRYIGAVSRAILRTQCADAPGLIATVTGACMRAGFNIVSNAEHVDRERDLYDIDSYHIHVDQGRIIHREPGCIMY